MIGGSAMVVINNIKTVSDGGAVEVSPFVFWFVNLAMAALLVYVFYGLLKFCSDRG